MSTTVIDRNGVAMAGPDKPALAPEGSVVVLAPVGGVSPAQAGILDYETHARTHPHSRDEAGSIRANTVTGAVNDTMIDRAHAAAPGLDRGTIEDILRAGLGLTQHPITGV